MSMSRSAAQLLLLDDPQEWSAFGRPHSPAAPAGPADPATVWDSQVVLEGMHCAACALTIEDALRAVPGGLQAVDKGGYRAMPAVDALAREQRLRASRQALWRWLVAGFCMMQVMMYAWP